jgi:citrate/tricarballylate utilization protein
VTPLEALVHDAVDVAARGAVHPAAPEIEVARVLQICNACRYCEGFCAVFPAMTRRLEFPAADIHYLANLCHNCGACLHACQYASPHEFDVNVPRAMARVRSKTYTDYAWPAALGRLYERNGIVVALVLVLSLAMFLAFGLALHGSMWGGRGTGSFYAVFPHGLMVWMFAPVFGFALLALGVGVVRFWRDISPGAASGAAAGEAAANVLTLKYLDGGHGEGCNNDSDAFSLARRRFHQLTFYGFALCFAATCVGTLYHYAWGWAAPYGWTSLPKLLGAAGGIGLLAGTAGLWWLHRRRHPQHGDPRQRGMDLAFIALLFVASLSGLALAVLRTTPALALLLCLHLGTVMALFATMPYGKFAHGVYRSAALLKWAIERRLPPGLSLGPE